ncbi:MAG TPA: hypothetical protein VFY14_15095 [Streptomyces sp.]|nr:hypothetical protein [Streptomyces sp.]
MTTTWLGQGGRKALRRTRRRVLPPPRQRRPAPEPSRTDLTGTSPHPAGSPTDSPTDSNVTSSR